MAANRIGAVILAAGESSRLGRPKQLLPFRGKSLVRGVTDSAVAANCSPVLVVLGRASEQIKSELKLSAVTIVKNDDWRAGIGTSIRYGVCALIDASSELDGIVLLACDQPFVDAKVIAGLIQLHQETHQPIVASAYAGTLGVPALFHSSCFQELLALDDEGGAKSIILRERERVAEFPFPDGAIDIDTAADYDKLQGRGD